MALSHTTPLAAIAAILEELPNWAVIRTGQSVNGQPIPLLAPTANAPSQTLDALIKAAIHGDEVESIDLILAWAKQYQGDKAIGLLPCVNPDGLAAKTRQNANGVDLNRNFPTQNWAPFKPNDDPHYHPGPSAGSEPETQFLIDIIKHYQPKKILTIHTPYRVINYDGPALDLAKAMAEINGYEVVSDIGYATPGSFGTYTGIERNIPVITLELPEGEAYSESEQHHNIAAINAFVAF